MARQTKVEIYHKKQVGVVLQISKLLPHKKAHPEIRTPTTEGSVYVQTKKLSLSWYQLLCYLDDKCSENVTIVIIEEWNRSV